MKKILIGFTIALFLTAYILMYMYGCTGYRGYSGFAWCSAIMGVFCVFMIDKGE